MKYSSVIDCNTTSSCEIVILHTIKEQWIAIVKWKTNSLNRICNRHSEKNALEVLIVKSYGTMLNSANFIHCFISKLRKSLSREIAIKKIYFQRENYLVPS